MSDATVGPAIRAEGLGVRVRDRVLLDDAAFRVERGEIVLLAGPSGSGKTVLLNLLAGLITRRTPAFNLTGRLEVQGHDAIGKPGSTRGSVGLVFQDYALFEGLTAATNVGFALDHRRPRVAPEARRAESAKLLERLELDGSAR